jgi:hypothetical protein
MYAPDPLRTLPVGGTLLFLRGHMRAIAGAYSIFVALILCGCTESVRPQSGAASNDVEFGQIEATIRHRNDHMVTVELRWTFRQVAPNISVAELPPVQLFNDLSDIRATPIADPVWNDGEVRFEASVDVTKEAWQHGCWQADYRIDGFVGLLDITCLNAGV